MIEIRTPIQLPEPRNLAAELVDRGDGWHVSPELCARLGLSDEEIAKFNKVSPGYCALPMAARDPGWVRCASEYVLCEPVHRRCIEGHIEGRPDEQVHGPLHMNRTGFAWDDEDAAAARREQEEREHSHDV